MSSDRKSSETQPQSTISAESGQAREEREESAGIRHNASTTFTTFSSILAIDQLTENIDKARQQLKEIDGQIKDLQWTVDQLNSPQYQKELQQQRTAQLQRILNTMVRTLEKINKKPPQKHPDIVFQIANCAELIGQSVADELARHYAERAKLLRDTREAMRLQSERIVELEDYCQERIGEISITQEESDGSYYYEEEEEQEEVDEPESKIETKEKLISSESPEELAEKEMPEEDEEETTELSTGSVAQATI